ncbi:ABC transporter permease [Paraburkholderia ferrariae]|uniref:ABC transporter permease n=1 Tax=Paraburkholderia ferrariae TaxID=386056 RepID=UPI0005A7AD33|nr:ABC transporter permease [Paraburkholderia ferrariae]
MKHPVNSPRDPVIKIRRARGKLSSWWLTTAVLVIAVLLWQAVSMAGIFPAFALPSPVAVWQAFLEIARNGYGGQTLVSDILISCFRIVIGFVGAIAIGVPIGLLMSRSKVVFDIIDPLLQFVRPVPPLAYIPLLVVWFGIGELPKAILILVGTIPVIIIGTMSGVKSTPALRISVARTLGASNAQIFRRVVLPSALPEIFTAMRVGIGVAWTCLVAAELIAASSGLGWLVQFAGQALQVGIVIVGIVIIGLIGYAMELVIRKIENWVVPWSGHN